MDRDTRLETKIDKISDRLNSIDATLAAQHESLKIHIKRTELLEHRMVKEEAFSNKISGALKVLGSASIIVSLLKLLKMF